MRLNLSQIRQLRQKFHLKQYDICRYLKVSDVAYRTWECRVRNPNEVHYERLKNIFSVLDEFSSEIVDRESALQVLDRELANE